MVQIGKKVKYDNYGRVTIPSELADLLDLIKGEDEITWDVIDGCVCLFKVTKTYSGGFEFESDEIRNRLLEYERKYVEDFDDESEDPEVLEERARQEYNKDCEKRKELRKRKNQ